MIRYNILKNPGRTLEEAAKYSFYRDIMDDDTFNQLNSIYPKYSVWVLNMYKKLFSNLHKLQMTIPEWGSVIRPYLEKYKWLQDSGFFRSEYANMNDNSFIPGQYRDLQLVPDPSILKRLVQSVPVLEFEEDFKFRNYKRDADYTVVYSDDNWLITLPKNFLACILFGGGDYGNGKQTQWCVSSKNNASEGHYNRYNKDLEGHCPIMFLQNNQNKERWLIGGNDDLVNDELDNELTEEDRTKLLEALPEEAVAKADELTGNKFSELMKGELGGAECAYCGDIIPQGENSETVGGEEWCESCYQHHAGFCESCESNVRSENMQHTDRDRYLCSSCADSLSTCDDCGDLIDEGGRRDEARGWCDNNGTCYCAGCWESHTICGDCGCFTNNPEQGDDEDYYCESCIDDHKTEEPEDEEEEEPEEENIVESSKRLFKFKRWT